MKRVVKQVLFVWMASASILLSGGLLKGEHQFRALKSYRIHDFHFAKPIVYMDIVTFGAKGDIDGNRFQLPKNYMFQTLLRVGKLPFSQWRKERDFDYLAHAILKKEYFWKRVIPLLWEYSFITLRFWEGNDHRLKAITQQQDILDIFGEIDTPAELHVWLKAVYSYSELYFLVGWKKVNGLYRIHFKGLNNFCIYDEHFDYFDKHGKKVKSTTLKHYRKKGCVEALP